MTLNQQQLVNAIGDATDARAAMQAAVDALKAQLPHYTWVGIYMLEGDELVLGPFLGKPSPHTRIPLNRGICGAAASQKATIIVDDVNSDPRYLACSMETKSEIVVHIMRGDRVLGEMKPAADFVVEVRIAAEALATAQGRVTLTSDRAFVAGERDGTADRRRLALRIYSVTVEAAPR